MVGGTFLLTLTDVNLVRNFFTYIDFFNKSHQCRTVLRMAAFSCFHVYIYTICDFQLLLIFV